MISVHRNDPVSFVLTCGNRDTIQRSVTVATILYDDFGVGHSSRVVQIVLQPGEVRDVVLGPVRVPLTMEYGGVYHLFGEVRDESGGAVASIDNPNSVFLTVEGDVNGDGVVDNADLEAVGAAYESVPGDPNWNRNADITNDRKVDLFDLATVGINFGRSV